MPDTDDSTPVKSLYELIYRECEEEHFDQDAIKAICIEFEQRLANLERANLLLTRSVLPAGHWAAPDQITNNMVIVAIPWLVNWQHMNKATKESNLDEAFKAMRLAYLKSRGEL